MKIIITIILFLITFNGFSQNPEQFIKNYARLAKNEQHRVGVPASVQLALGILISKSQTTYVSKHYNNIFNLQCFSNSCNEGHCKEFKHKKYYYIFQHPAIGWKYNNNRLKKYKNNNYKNFCNYLEKGSYLQEHKLTSQDLIFTIEKYKLYKYDK